MCNVLRSWTLLALVTASSVGCDSNLILPGDDSPAALKPVSGDGQEGTVGSQLDDPLVVRVVDASAQPVEGVLVEFQLASDVPNADVTPLAISDSEGKAAAEVRLGTEVGSMTVLAQVAQASSSELRATFGVTAVADKGNKGKGGGRDRDEDEEEDED